MRQSLLIPSLSTVASSLLAALTVLLGTLLLHLLRTWLGTPVIALLYLLPVGLSTALWGLWPGVVAACGAFLAFNYFFLPPYYTLLVHSTQDLLVLAVFFVVAVTVSQLVGRARFSLAEAQAREREATHLYELSTALAGERSADAITSIIARQLAAVFQAQYVEVVAQPDLPGTPILCRQPETGAPPSDPPGAVLPLTTSHGLLGEIRLWRGGPPVSPVETRLLGTFASQGALALERAALARAETRTRVLEESDRLKSALLSSVSHELRTPLATIKAAVTSLAGEDVSWDDAARRELLATVNDEVDMLNRLVGNLLDMSRIEAGALTVQREWNLLSEIVGGALQRLRHAAQHHRLAVDLPDDLPLVPVDYVLMEQVFANLLSNCLKYAPPGSTVRVGGRAAGPVLQVCVSNEGPPVPAEHLERIFDKFHRVTAADRVTGTGLGLSICRGIVEAHGGRIWAENLSPQGGFAFNFSLPLTWQGVPPPHLPEEVDTP